MNVNVIKQWVADLRSGDYDQYTGGALKSVDKEGNISYCCLGVYFCVTNKNELSPIPEGENEINTNELYLQIGKEIDPFLGEGYRDELVHMNDGGGYTFDEIADYIEDKLDDVASK